MIHVLMPFMTQNFMGLLSYIYKQELEHEYVESTQKLVDKAAKEAEESPCLWLRGILPIKFVQIDSKYDPTDDIISEYINPEQLDWASHTYYGTARSRGETI